MVIAKKDADNGRALMGRPRCLAHKNSPSPPDACILAIVPNKFRTPRRCQRTR